MKPCTRCRGRKARADIPCPFCSKTGLFPKPDNCELIPRLLAKRGKNVGRLRTSPPPREKTLLGRRVFYIWKMAMFEGPSRPFQTLELSYTSFFLLPFPSELRPRLVPGLRGVHFVFEVQGPLGKNQSTHLYLVFTLQ